MYKTIITMKKILSIACVALVVAALASCKKTYVTQVTDTPNQTWLHTVQTSDWALTTDGKSDSVDVTVPNGYEFFNQSDATLVYFSFVSGVYEQVPEVFNGISYSYFHYVSNNSLHMVLYAQSAGGTTPTKPTSSVGLKLVLIPSVNPQQQ